MVSRGRLKPIWAREDGQVLRILPCVVRWPFGSLGGARAYFKSRNPLPTIEWGQRLLFPMTHVQASDGSPVGQ